MAPKRANPKADEAAKAALLAARKGKAMNPDMKSFSETKLIPNTEVTHFFEAPFVFKRNGIYYFQIGRAHV